MKVPFFRHDLRPDLSVEVQKVLGAPILTSGAVCRSVEAQLCEFFGVPYARMTNSWTNGAIAILLALNIGPGDEVIVPAMTFIASSNVVEIVGARAVFVDVEPDTLLMDINRVVEALSPATKAIIPVHLYGQMVDVKALRESIHHRPDVFIIEDAAHCFEGNYLGAKPGQHSDAAIFSFYATKNVTCGEGGAIITRHPDLFEIVSQSIMQGMSADAAERFTGSKYQHWDMLHLGTKANMSDLLACLLPQQIDTVEERLSVREGLSRRYEEAFAGSPVRIGDVRSDICSARHLFPIHVPGAVRDIAIDALGQRGIGVTVNYRSVPTLTYYRDKYGHTEKDFPISFEWGAGTISLPMFPGLTAEEQQYVIDTIFQDVVPLIEKATVTAI